MNDHVPNQPFTVVSGYTVATPYEHEIQHLLRSLDLHSIDQRIIVAFESKGTWEKNCAHKATILLQAMQQCKTNVVWIDADAVVVQYPTLFDTITNQFAAYFDKGKILKSGTLFFKYSDPNVEMIQHWIDSCQRDPTQWDQRVLQQVVNDLHPDTLKLPHSYCKKFDQPTGESPVIMHNQASRRFKKLINNGHDTNIYCE